MTGRLADGGDEGVIGTYGSVVGKTLMLPSPTDTWIPPIEVIAPDDNVDPPMTTPPPEAFSIPCPFKAVKAPMVASDGTWMVLSPMTIPSEFWEICTPLIGMMALLTDWIWFPSTAIPPLGWAATVCPATVTCAASGATLVRLGGWSCREFTAEFWRGFDAGSLGRPAGEPWEGSDDGPRGEFAAAEPCGGSAAGSFEDPDAGA